MLVSAGVTFGASIGLSWTGSRISERDARAKAANERKIAELEEARRPRTLVGDDRARFITALRSAQSKGPIDVACILGNVEGCAYAAQLHAALKEAGWLLPNSNVSGLAYLSAQGRAILVLNPRQPPALATILQRACATGGLRFDLDSDPTLAQDAVRLFIGSK
jgi:hypothetical protein